MTSDIQIKAPEDKQDFEQMVTLICKCFSGIGYYRVEENCRKGYVHHSNYDWNASRVGFLADRLVTHYGIWDYQMRIGEAAVRVGGVGAVATDAPARRKGLMARTAQASIEAMRADGYDFSLLFGIRNFYHQFGYVPAWPSSSYSLSVDDLPADKPSGPLRSFPGTHREDTGRLYNREHKGLTGTAIRPTFPKRNAFQVSQGLRWLDGRGRTSGYLTYNTSGDSLTVCDAAGDPEQILRAAAQLARRARKGHVRLQSLHSRSRLARYVRKYPCRFEARYERSGGAMIRLMDLPQVLGKIEGELTRRLAESPFAKWSGTLSIEGPEENAALKIGRGRVRCAPAEKSRHRLKGGFEIARLIIGSSDPMEIAESAEMKLSGEAAGLIKALFPPQDPCLSHWDGF